jgi:hypothetical protein
MNGMRRPHRERLLSDTEPSRGSAMASAIRLMAAATPTSDPGRPRTAV